MLIDTNIIIEVGRSQAKSKECCALLDLVEQGAMDEDVYISEFSLRAIQALISEASPKFVKEIMSMIYNDQLKIFRTKPDDDLLILGALNGLGLDFDDATQFVATNKLGTYIVTYDKDFKKTGLEIKTPREILKEVLGLKITATILN